MNGASSVLNSEQEKVLDSIRPGKIILPSIIGVLAVGFLVRSQLDFEELRGINWTIYTLFWIILFHIRKIPILTIVLRGRQIKVPFC